MNQYFTIIHIVRSGYYLKIADSAYFGTHDSTAVPRARARIRARGLEFAN